VGNGLLEIALWIGLTLVLAATAVWILVRRRRIGPHAIVRASARRLGGRIDPASERMRFPAILVDMDQRLIRAAGWPSDSEACGAEHPAYLEICTPVEGVTSPILVVRRSVIQRLLPLLTEDLRKHSVRSGESVCVFGAHPALWACSVFEAKPNWVLLELDSRMLRVLTADPQETGFGAQAVESAVRQFRAAVPGILFAAGLTDSARRD
jgi:hypothetical protein